MKLGGRGGEHFSFCHTEQAEIKREMGRRAQGVKQIEVVVMDRDGGRKSLFCLVPLFFRFFLYFVF